MKKLSDAQRLYIGRSIKLNLAKKPNDNAAILGPDPSQVIYLRPTKEWVEAQPTRPRR